MSLGQHVNTWTGSARGTVRAAPGAILKVLNTAIDRDELIRYKQARPDGLVVYRHVFPDGSTRQASWRCAQLLASVAPIKDLVNVVETPWNEEMQGGDELATYAAMTNQAVSILEEAGFDTAIGNFSTSQPDLSNFHLFAPALVRSKRRKYLSVHEYGAPRMQDGGGCLRYRRWVYLWPDSILVTECGIDGGVIGTNHAKQGWRNFTDANEYAAQLRWYDGELAKDGVRAAIFACGTYDDWSQFDIAGQGVIENAIKTSATPPQQPQQGGTVPADFTSPNHEGPRAQTLGIVIHATFGNSATAQTEYTSTCDYFQNPAPGGDPRKAVSAHAVAGPGGAVHRPVKPDLIAWHCGRSNQTHLGIELAKPRLGDAIAPDILDAAAKVVARWCQDYKIPIVWNTAHGLAEHHEMPTNVDGHSDVGGPFDRNDFLARVKRYAGQGDELTDAQRKTILDDLDFLWAYSKADQIAKNPAESEKILHDRIVGLKVALGLNG